MGGGLPNGVFPALALLFPATEESLRAGVATLFGEAEARTAAHYRLENDIDATQTGQTNWHEGQGFLPIGDSASPFLGALDGAGYAIRGLQMRRAGEMAGFFGVVGASGRISNLGVDGGEVEGDSMVGLLAARVEAGGVIEGAWGRGRVRGSDNVGGLAGYLADGATMKRSWFGGYVRGRRNVGGLVGGAEARSESADTIADSWAMAQTRAFVGVGGLAGNWESGNRMTASWAGGPLTGIECERYVLAVWRAVRANRPRVIRVWKQAVVRRRALAGRRWIRCKHWSRRNGAAPCGILAAIPIFRRCET